jgi:hypothetical protein
VGLQQRKNLTFALHSAHPDWCHLCGENQTPSLDLWFPENAEHGGPKDRYLRMCWACARTLDNALRLAQTQALIEAIFAVKEKDNE